MFLAIVVTSISAGGPNVKAGMDMEHLQTIRGCLQGFVDKGTLSGAVTLVMRHGSVMSLEAVGYHDMETHKPMATNAIFQIHSMTKPITAIGVMMLLEQGRVSLGDPVEKYLPDFRGQWMVKDRGDKTMSLQKPQRQMTIRDLITHTSGMGDWPEALRDLPEKRNRKLADAVLIYSQAPLEFSPGTKWLYSSVGVGILGRIIEVVSGQSIEQFMNQRIFRPLGMNDTCFFPEADKYPRIPIAYEYVSGKPRRAEVDLYRKGALYPSPSGGLFSTASDMAKICQMMLNGGSLGDTKILSRASVDRMTSVQTGELKVGNSPEAGFGLGWFVVRDSSGATGSPSVGNFFHGGAWGTFMSVDPARDLVFVFMTQRSAGGSAEERNAVYSIALSSIVE
jgi:CubicO group peptidase (beta-lactamase class C family)